MPCAAALSSAAVVVVSSITREPSLRHTASARLRARRCRTTNAAPSATRAATRRAHTHGLTVSDDSAVAAAWFCWGRSRIALRRARFGSRVVVVVGGTVVVVVGATVVVVVGATVVVVVGATVVVVVGATVVVVVGATVVVVVDAPAVIVGVGGVDVDGVEVGGALVDGGTVGSDVVGRVADGTLGRLPDEPPQLAPSAIATSNPTPTAVRDLMRWRAPNRP